MIAYSIERLRQFQHLTRGLVLKRHIRKKIFYHGLWAFKSTRCSSSTQCESNFTTNLNSLTTCVNFSCRNTNYNISKNKTKCDKKVLHISSNKIVVPQLDLNRLSMHREASALHTALPSQLTNAALNNIDDTNYAIKKSPPDGHCLLHSIVANVESLTLKQLIDIITTEFYSNLPFYSIFLENPDVIHQQFLNYIHHKQYNSALGDLIPLIISNALNRKIRIFNEQMQLEHEILSRVILNDSPILVILRHEHYDAIIPLSCSPRSSSDTHTGPAGANPGPRVSTTTEPRTTRPPLPPRISIATLNCRTLKDSWRLRECVVLCKSMNIDVLAIQETRRRNQTDIETNGYVLKTTPANSSGVGGIGFLFSPRAWKAVLDISLTPRIASVDIQTEKRMIRIVNVYAPTAPATEHDPSETESVYSRLGNIVNQTPSRILLTILGDFNAPLNAERHLVRNQAPGQENANSDHLRALLNGHNMWTVNGNIRQHPRSLPTFYGPNKRITRLDWILTRYSQRHHFKSVRNTRLTSLLSDHTLLTTQIDGTWHRGKNPAPRPHWGALKQVKVRSKFQSTFHKLGACNNAHELETNIKIASATLPSLKRPKHCSLWMSDPAVEKARRNLQSCTALYGQGSTQSTTAATQLQEEHAAAAKREIDSLVTDLQTANAHGHTKQAWQIINSVTGRKDQPRTILSATSTEDRKNQLIRHYSNILNNQPAHPELLHAEYDEQTAEFDTGPIRLDEVTLAAKKARADGACGLDDIPTQALLALPHALLRVTRTHSPIHGGSPPPQWLRSKIISIPKKGTSTALDNQRGISLMCIPAKITNRVLLNRLLPHIIHRLSPLQCGFLPGRSTIEQCVALRIAIDDCRAHQRPIAITFVDFRKAFDSVSRNTIPLSLRLHGVPEILIDAVMSLCTNTSACVKTKEGLTTEFKTTSGVLQGDTLAPLLFIIALDAVLQDAKLNIGAYQLQCRRSTRHPEVCLPYLGFADDLAILSRDNTAAQASLERLTTSAAKIGLVISAPKTKVLQYGLQKIPLKLPDGSDIESVDDFIYLGSKSCSAQSVFRHRKALAWTAARKLSNIWNSPVDNKAKIRLFNASVEPVFAYGLEALPLTTTMTTQLDAAHRNLARFAMGIHYPDTINNIALRNVGVHALSTVVKERRQAVIRKADPHSGLKLLLAHPPTELLRRGMSRLLTIRQCCRS